MKSKLENGQCRFVFSCWLFWMFKPGHNISKKKLLGRCWHSLLLWNWVWDRSSIFTFILPTLGITTSVLTILMFFSSITSSRHSAVPKRNTLLWILSSKSAITTTTMTSCWNFWGISQTSKMSKWRCRWQIDCSLTISVGSTNTSSACLWISVVKKPRTWLRSFCFSYNATRTTVAIPVISRAISMLAIASPKRHSMSRENPILSSALWKHSD